MDELIIDCRTNEQTRRPLTTDEVALRAVAEEEVKAQEAAARAESERKQELATKGELTLEELTEAIQMVMRTTQ